MVKVSKTKTVEQHLNDVLKESFKNRTKKLKFNKFLPEDNGFIKLNGSYDPKDKDNFEIELVIQSGLRNTLSLWSWGFDDLTNRKTLEAIHEATTKALKFLDEAAESQKNISKDIKAKRVTKTK